MLLLNWYTYSKSHSGGCFTLSSSLIFEKVFFLLYSLSSRLALLSLKLLLKGLGALLYLLKVLAIKCSRIHLSVFSNRGIMIWA